MNTDMKPRYGLVTSLCMVVGSVIGTGIFLRSGKMSLAAGGDTTAIILAWIIGAIMIIPIATIISEVASMTTESGGPQVYAEKTISKRFGFAVGWSQSFFYLPAMVSMILWLVAEYTLKIAKLEHLGVPGTIYLASFYGTALFLINMLSPKSGGTIQVVSTFIKVIPLVGVTILGLLYFGDKIDVIGSPELLNQLNMNADSSFITKVASILPPVIFSLDGWIIICIVTKEIINPNRNIPLSVVGGLSVVSILYLLFTIASFNVASSVSLGTEGSSTIDIAKHLFGDFFGSLLNIFVVISAIGVANSKIIAIIRAPYSLTKNKTFIGSNFLSKLQGKNDMPIHSGIVALLFVLAYLLIPFFLNKVNGGEIYGFFIDTALLLFFAYYSLICFGVFRMRKTQPNAYRPFKAPFIMLLLIISFMGCGFGIYGLITAYALLPVVIFLVCSLSGFVFYSFVTDSNK